MATQARTIPRTFCFSSLIKSLKNKRQLFRRDPHPGIIYGKLNPVLPLNEVRSSRTTNISLFGKLERVVDQVEQNLIEESGIGTQILRDFWRNLALKFDRALRKPEFKGFAHGLGHTKEVEVFQMGLHFPLLNFGNVQYVTNQRLQQIG